MTRDMYMTMMDGSGGQAMKSVLIAVRVPEAVKKKAESKAKKLGYIKPSGEANLSEYLRNLIINDRR